ncbi:conserved hypothetical protein [Neospora caninum Liverpool]|uniref:Uncharacterized protein n=1 Tax=Neospora caninum (strain Liverpool) TaxID=572307 RepID=F0VEX1_NEOCL|nr:conserved hypothetical protein [Neospora caninum Liverpool]CBZ52265.1 conserved hypothetical protein [Neospora caninum Liverpool]|eukprot:XP_003882297.1 conserved hypothetical protein [Neospora caninum Liverpool]
MGEDDPVKNRLLQQALDPTVQVALDSIPPSCVTLEVRFTITYETEPGVNFHVGFNLLDKNYDAGYVSTWDVLKTASLPEQALPPAISARSEKSPRPLRAQISKAVTTFGSGPPTTSLLEAAASSSTRTVTPGRTLPSGVAEKPEELEAPRFQVVTATSTVSVEGVSFSWALCQQVANEVMTVSLGRKEDGSLEPAPKASPNSGASQREVTVPSKKGAAKGESGMNATAAVAKEKGKPKGCKEVKALPVFEMHRQGQIRIGSVLLLTEGGSIKSCRTVNQVFATLDVVNQIALRRFLEDFAFTVELHDQDILATSNIDNGVDATDDVLLKGCGVAGTSGNNAGAKQGYAASPGSVSGGRALSPTLPKLASLPTGSQSGLAADASKESRPAGTASSPRHGPSLSASSNHRKSRFQSPGRPEPPETKKNRRLTTEDEFERGTFEARIIRPHGAATFRFQELLRHGLKRIELASAVYPVLGTGGVPVLEQTTLLKDQTASELLAQPNNYLTRFFPGKMQRVSTRYMDYGTELALRVRLSEPLPSIEKIHMLQQAGQRLPKVRMKCSLCRCAVVLQNREHPQEEQIFEEHDGEQEATPGDRRALEPVEVDPAFLYEPFGCLVLFIHPGRKPLIQKLVKEVDRRNMQAMNVDTRDALSLEILPVDDEESRACDVLTGFILSDEK